MTRLHELHIIQNAPPIADTDEDVLKAIHRDACNSFLESKGHITMAILLCERAPIAFFDMSAEDNTEKQTFHAFLGKLAESINFDAIIVISEAWMTVSLATNTTHIPPSESPLRTEVLMLTHATRHSPPRMILSTITRNGEDVSLDETPMHHYPDVVPLMLRPVYDAWNIELPEIVLSPPSSADMVTPVPTRH